MQMPISTATSRQAESPVGSLSTFESMGHALCARMASTPHRLALRDLDGSKNYTYAEVARRVAHLCDLFERSGLKRGDSLATNYENGPGLAILILSSLIFGTQLALIESQTPAAKLKYFLDMVAPRAIFIAGTTAAEIGIGADIQWLSVSASMSGDELPEARHTPRTAPSDEAIVIFSSGTTGSPKGVVHTQDNIVAECDAMIEAYDFVESMQHYALLPLGHVSGLYRSLLMPFFTGGTISMRRQFDPQLFWDDLREQKVEFVQLVPSHVALLNRSSAGPQKGHGMQLRFVGTASGYLPPKEQAAFEQRFGVPLLQGYGLTECTCGIVLNSLDPAIRRPGAAGLPLKVNKIKIVDNAGIEVENGEVGEVLVSGRNVAKHFLGYDGPEFDQGWLKTGDLGRFDEAGNIVLVGRRVSIINRGAYKIYALEVEEALASVPGVNEAAVIGVPDPVLGQDIIAFVTLDRATEPAQLLGALRPKLSSFKIPSQIIPIDRMPQNRLGKIVKDELLQLYTRRQSDRSAVDESMILLRLCRLIADIFAVDISTIKANSSRETIAQWDSLGHVQVLAAIEQTFGVRIADEAAVAAQSVSDLANAIVNALRNKAARG
jgi:acyl-CoA synthetase (AMP-forming)/AMP-acid ligase II/acyl carrier protein